MSAKESEQAGFFDTPLIRLLLSYFFFFYKCKVSYLKNDCRSALKATWIFEFSSSLELHTVDLLVYDHLA